MASDLQLYLFDSRTIDLGNVEVPVPFFLVRHPEGDVLIDGGNPLAVARDARAYWGPLADEWQIHMSEEQHCATQLEQLGEAVSIRYGRADPSAHRPHGRARPLPWIGAPDRRRLRQRRSMGGTRSAARAVLGRAGDPIPRAAAAGRGRHPRADRLRARPEELGGAQARSRAVLVAKSRLTHTSPTLGRRRAPMSAGRSWAQSAGRNRPPRVPDSCRIGLGQGGQIRYSEDGATDAQAEPRPDAPALAQAMEWPMASRPARAVRALLLGTRSSSDRRLSALTSND